MSYITWQTKSGNLGTIPETQYYNFQLYATSSAGGSIVYSVISGTIPPGLQLIQRDVLDSIGNIILPAGTLQGVPTINQNTSRSITYVFTIRATDQRGAIADRSFTVSISNINITQILVPDNFIGAYFDGTYINYKFNSSQTNANAVLEWSVVNGTLPPGLSLSISGILSGYADPVAEVGSYSGYDTTPNDTAQFDALQLSVDKYYSFTVQLFDGNNYTTQDVKIWIISKARYSADNVLTVTNNTFIPVDADNVYLPIITSDPTTIPTYVQNNNFAYQFQGYDIEGYPITWQLNVQNTYGFDQVPFDYTDVDNVVYAFDQGLLSLPANLSINQNTGWLTGSLPSQTETEVTYNFNVVANKTVTYSFFTANVTTSNANILVSKVPSNLSTGDLLLGLSVPVTAIAIYRNDISSVLPYETITINSPITVPPGQIISYNKIYSSKPTNFNITVLKNANDIVTWTTPSNLGSIQNGAVSQLSTSAVRSNGSTNIVYSTLDKPYLKLPNGLKMLPSGRIIGRPSFEYFTLDSAQSKITVDSVINLSVGMTVSGAGVPTGAEIIGIDVVTNLLTLSPSIYVTQGTSLVISDAEGNQYNVTVVSNSQSTTIDGGNTTFDNTYNFTVQATTIDGQLTATKTFSLLVDNYNLSPYENVYLKALLSTDQRKQFLDIINDRELFPNELIYRADDPWFGRSSEMKFLFLAGLHPSLASTFVSAIQQNHYNKRINFSDVKVAQAVDTNFNPIYEVIYLDVIDDQSINDMGPALEILMKYNPYLYGNTSYDTIYPNSFPNMQKRLETLGYTNKGALPGWMTSPQTNGKILGLTRAIVLAYVIPGAGNLISYRLKSQGIAFNSIDFVADRYQWDNGLSTNYNISANKFNTGTETTFDLLLKNVVDVFATSISANYIGTGGTKTFNINDRLSIGYGWSITSLDANSTIPDGTKIIAVSGTSITVNSNIIALAGAVIEINGSTTVNYALTQSFENINRHSVYELQKNLRIDGRSDFLPGQTLIFAQQENFIYTTGNNNGWNNYTGVFDASSGFDNTEFDEADVIPGYFDKLSGASTANERAGVWRINFVNFDLESYVELTFVKEIVPGQQINVLGGNNYPGTTLFYDTALVNGRTVPAYSVAAKTSGAPIPTTFDGSGTKFINNRDAYTMPDSLSTYIKFPQIGVFV